MICKILRSVIQKSAVVIHRVIKNSFFHFLKYDFYKVENNSVKILQTLEK